MSNGTVSTTLKKALPAKPIGYMRKDRLQRIFSLLRLYLRHATIHKLNNLARAEYKLFRNNCNVASVMPHYLVVEISNACNLKCPLCQMGLRETIPRENKMTAVQYRSFIHPLAKHLFTVFLFDWGEPFLNREIYEIIRCNSENNIGTVVSTNGNIPIDADKLVESGLDYLIVSGDGATQETYSTYRRGGTLSVVLKNLDAVVAAKKRTGSKKPFIEWQCLVTKYNESELPIIRQLAKQHGADTVRFANINLFSHHDPQSGELEWLPADTRFRAFSIGALRNKKPIRKPCYWLWRTAVVNVNGGVNPCCLYDIPDWGNAFSEGLHAVWNNPLFTEARNRSNLRSPHKTETIICDSCKAAFIFK